MSERAERATRLGLEFLDELGRHMRQRIANPPEQIGRHLAQLLVLADKAYPFFVVSTSPR